MDINDTTLDTLAEWAAGRKDVRALILTSTRAIPGGRLDAYSDFDVIVIVDDVRAMLGDTTWQAEFGEVLIAYWDPLEVDSATGADWVSNITNYTNGLKIDFNLWSQQRYADVTAGPNPYPEFDAGYRIIVDKDDLTADLPAPPSPPTSRRDRMRRPTYDSSRTSSSGVPYVANGLLRDELLPTKWVLDFDMRFNYLLPLLEWRVECDYDWTMRTGNLGLWSQGPSHDQYRVPPRADIQRRHAGSELDRTIRDDQFVRTRRSRSRRPTRYQYPEDLVTAVTDHARRMRDGVFAAGPLHPE